MILLAALAAGIDLIAARLQFLGNQWAGLTGLASVFALGTMLTSPGNIYSYWITWFVLSFVPLRDIARQDKWLWTFARGVVWAAYCVMEWR